MEFKDLQQTWQQQTENETKIPDFTPAKQKLASLRKQQQYTKLILGITVAVLLVYFFYIAAYKFSGMFLGMVLLIGVILVRIVIEIKSRQKLKKINVLLSFIDFKAELVVYYQQRKNLAFKVIPALLIVYNIGFIIMSYYFYQYLSRGFFYYVISSYLVSFVILFFVIRKQVLQELKILKTLQEN